MVHPSHGHDQTIVNGISRIGYMTGGKAALWKDEDMADVFTGQATAFIDQHHRNPAEGAVIDPDRRADDPAVVNGGETARRREQQEHAPVREALIPASRGA